MVEGEVAAGFEPVADVFRRNVTERGDSGAALCIYRDGRKVVDLYQTDAVQVVRSVTKGVMAILAHLLSQRGLLDFDAPVVDVWPEFGAAGKQHIPIRWLFSHQSGLCAIDRPLTFDDAVAWDPVVEALASQAPLWEPGTRHGYHALTYGWLTGEVIRRVTGRTAGALVAEELSGPLGLDLWLGLPPEQLPRVAPLLPGPPIENDPIAKILADPTSLGSRAFLNPLLFVGEADPRYLMAEVPAANGVTNARSLARLFAATIGPVDGVRLLDEATMKSAADVQAEGMDAVTNYETRYATGFQRPFPMRPMAGVGTACVGHYGMGGPLGFADPEHGIGFGYTSLQIQNHVGADPRSRLLAEALW